MELNLKEIEAIARQEIEQEKRRIAIDAAKERIRRAKWWHRFIHFTIRIERRM